MGAAAGKFAEWVIFGAYFVIIFALALVTFPWLPGLLAQMPAVGAWIIPVEVTDLVANLWQNEVTQAMMIGLIAAASLTMIIVAGAAVEAQGGMTYWEITAFKEVLQEHKKRLGSYVEQNIPQLRDEYEVLADPTKKVSTPRAFGKGNRELRQAYHKVTDALIGKVFENAWAAAPWYATKQQSLRMFRPMAGITYRLFLFTILSLVLAYFYHGLDPAVAVRTFLLMSVWFAYMVIVGLSTIQSVKRFWHSTFVLLYLLHEKQQGEQGHVGEAISPTLDDGSTEPLLVRRN